jgi:hypothetical protein
MVKLYQYMHANLASEGHKKGECGGMQKEQLAKTKKR